MEINAPRTAADLVSLHQSHISYFEDLWKRGAENEIYFKGQNFSNSQMEDIFNQNRTPFPNPVTADKLNRIIYSERNTRTSIKAEATNPNSEIKAELLTLRLKKLEQDSDMQYTESEIFASGVAAIYGAGKVIIDFDKKGNKVVKVVDIDYQNLVWDSNAKKYFKEDGAFMAERMQVYRRDIRRDYGDEIADNIDISSSTWGRQINAYFGTVDKYGNRDNDVIIIFEHYEKVLRNKYYIVWDGEVISKENSRDDADEVVRKLKIPYLTTGQELPLIDIVFKKDNGIDKYIFTASTILEYEMTDLEEYPYSVYQAFNFKDQIWCMTDILKPQNKLMDKLLSQIDYAFGADIKNGWEIVVPWLADGYSLEEATQMVQDGKPLPVMKPGALRQIASHGANPQWAQIYMMIKENLTEYSGGSLFSGTQPGLQREAKDTVALKLKYQEAVASLFVDNLRRWKRNIIEKAIWYIKTYDTEKYIMKTQGGNLSPELLQLLEQSKVYSPSKHNKGLGYLMMNQPDNRLSYLDDVDVDIIITEGELSETARGLRQQELLQFNQLAPGSITPEEFLEYSDMEYSLKQKIIENFKQQQQQAQQDKERAFELQQEELNIKKAQILVGDKGQVIPSVKKQKVT